MHVVEHDGHEGLDAWRAAGAVGVGLVFFFQRVRCMV